MSAESIVAIMVSSKIEISFAKVKNVAEFTEKQMASIADADDAIEKIWSWSQKQKDYKFEKLKTWKDLITTNGDVKKHIIKFVEKFSARYGVKNPKIFEDDTASVKRLHKVIAKIMRIRYKSNTDLPTTDDSDIE